MNKTKFLAIIRSRRARLEESLARLSEAELELRLTPDSWSIKDSLAHLTFYEQQMLNNVRRSLEAAEEIAGVTREEQTERNARIFKKNKDRPVAEVLAGK